MDPKLRALILFVVTAASIPILEALAKLDAEAVVRDPRPWALGLTAAAIRAAAVAVLGWMVDQRLTPRS